MLTLKLITEETDRVISGLEKKHFAGAKEAIDNVLAIDKRRRESQQQLDKVRQEAKQMAAKIGSLMKEGKKEEAEETKKQVADLKQQDKTLQEQMANAESELTTLLCQIPNIPYDEVPEGAAAEDNHVVKSNLKECDGNDTVGRIPCIYRYGRTTPARSHQLLPRRGTRLWLHRGDAADSGEPGIGLWHRTAA